MRIDHVLSIIAESRIIAIMRGDYRGAELEIVDVLTAAGVHAVEVTMNSPGAVGTIEAMASRFGSRFAIGAGTVLRSNEVDAVAAAGASFVVSPNRDVEVIGRTKRAGLASLPGCFTPSEIVEALNAGADAAKLFPARLISPELVADLRAPLGDVRLIPTGAVTATRARDYLGAGAWALGVGTALVSPDVLEPGGMDRLASRARAFVAGVRGE